MISYFVEVGKFHLMRAFYRAKYRSARMKMTNGIHHLDGHLVAMSQSIERFREMAFQVEDELGAAERAEVSIVIAEMVITRNELVIKRDALAKKRDQLQFNLRS